MRCEDIREKLVSFLLNELDPEERKQVEDHIASCEGCRSEVTEYEQTIRTLGRWKVPLHSGPPVFGLLPEKMKVKNSSSIGLETVFRIARYGIAAAIAAAIIAALLLGTHVQYGKANLTISVGRAVPSMPDSVKFAVALEEMHRRDIELFSQMIAASEARQDEFCRVSLASFAQQIGSQQRDYTNYLSNHMYHLQRQNELAYYQSEVALNGVIKLASAVK